MGPSNAWPQAGPSAGTGAIYFSGDGSEDFRLQSRDVRPGLARRVAGRSGSAPLVVHDPPALRAANQDITTASTDIDDPVLTLDDAALLGYDRNRPAEDSILESENTRSG